MLRVVCSAIIIKEKKIYLIKEQKVVARGLWGLPGGKLEEKESLEYCVRREVLEETGMTLVEADLFKVVNKPRSREGNTVVKCVFRCSINPQSASDAAEMEGAFCTLDEVNSLAESGLLRGQELPALCREALAAKESHQNDSLLLAI